VRRSAFIVVVSIFYISKTVAQTSAAAKPYDVAEAYRIYSLLLPQEESYGFAKDTLMIREETVSDAGIPRECLTPEAANKFKDAIATFYRIQTRKWLLQPRFQIEKPYRFYGPDAIVHRSDQSRPYVEMSVVGFNHEKTRAIVYMQSTCGGLCGSGRYHLLEKVHGNWKEISGVICAMAS
jgi:hypothetical protein